MTPTPTQILKLADDLIPDLLSELKVVTIRTGYRDIKPGPLTFKSVSGKDIVPVIVISVTYKLLRDLTEAEYKADGFASFEDVLPCMRTFYPTITLDSPVTVITYRLVKASLSPKHIMK